MLQSSTVLALFLLTGLLWTTRTTVTGSPFEPGAGRRGNADAYVDKKHDNWRFREPLWRPCLEICVAGCSNWEGYEVHLKQCAENCVRRGLQAFSPEEFCFELNK